MDNSTVFQFILDVLSIRHRILCVEIPVQLGVRLHLGTVCIDGVGIRTAAVVVVSFVIRWEVAQAIGWCSEGSGKTSILDYSTVFALNRTVPRLRRSVRRSVEGLVGAKSLLFFITGCILFDHGKVHVPLGSVGEILESRTARLLPFFRAGTAMDRRNLYVSRGVLALFSVKESVVGRIR